MECRQSAVTNPFLKSNVWMWSVIEALTDSRFIEKKIRDFFYLFIKKFILLNFSFQTSFWGMSKNLYQKHAQLSIILLFIITRARLEISLEIIKKHWNVFSLPQNESCRMLVGIWRHHVFRKIHSKRKFIHNIT